MKSWRIATILLLCLALVGFTACSSLGNDNQEETGQQLVKVVRGDLMVSVSGSGNIDVANEVRLVFGTNGRIDKIFIDEGDEVVAGEVLARLDTASLELSVTQAEVALAQARIARTQTEIARNQAQVVLAQAQAAQNQAQAAQLEIQAARNQAQIALDVAEDNVEDIENYVDRLKKFLADYSPKVEEAKELLETAQLQLEAAQWQLEAIDLQLEAARLHLEASGLQLEIAGEQLVAIESQLDPADLQVEAAAQALGEAQKRLNMVTIAAPFAGTVVSINVDEGDTVSPMVPILHLIDLSSVDLKAGFDEVDIPGVALNQRVIIDLDALPELQLEGRVSDISLIPTMQSGLVIYDVTISFDIAEDSGLRVGMSTTVDIIINERSDVLLVPNRAIEEDGQGNAVVMVQSGEQIREREVVVGISDGLEAEIISGLGEGETVVIESRTSANSSEGGFFFGG